MEKKKKKENSKSDSIKLAIYITIFAGIFIVLIFIHNRNVDEIESNYASTKGIIVKNMLEAKGSWGVKVKYEVNGVCYVRNFDGTFWCSNNSCLGDSIKVEFNAEDPNVSRIVRDNGETLYPSMKVGEQDYQVSCDTVFN